MYVFRVCWRMPGYRVRAVIVIVIYLCVFRLAPHASVPLTGGAVLGSLLAAAEPSRTGRAVATRETAR